MRKPLVLATFIILLFVAASRADSPPEQRQAEAVLAAARNLYRQLTSFSASVTQTTESFDAYGKLARRSTSDVQVCARRPNYWQLTFTRDGKSYAYQCDGKYRYRPPIEGVVPRYDFSNRPALDGLRSVRCCTLLRAPDGPLVEARRIPQMQYLGKLEHGGERCDVIQIRAESRGELVVLVFFDSRGVLVK